MEVNKPLDLKKLQADEEKAGAPWQVSYTSLTALTEEERVIRLGVPPSPGIDIESLEEGKESLAAAAAQATAEAIGRTATRGDDGTNDMLMSDVLRTNELQVWFVAEPLVNVPVVQV